MARRATKSRPIGHEGQPERGDRALSGHAQIVRTLGEDILAGRFVPGEKLPPEPELLDRFGVSRTSLREAIKTLTAKGLLVVKTRVGTKVSERVRWNLFDPEVLSWKVRTGMDADFRRHVAEMRRAVEPAAAALAARHRTADDLMAMRTAVAAMRAETRSEYGFARADLSLHLAIGAASNNPMMRSIASVIEIDLDLALDLVGLVAVDEDQRRAGRLGASPAPFRVRTPPSRLMRSRSPGLGSKKLHCTPYLSVVKSSDSAMPCGTALPPLGLGRGLDRSPPPTSNQPSLVQVTGASRVWRPRV
jgi:DNA-binding FadR family transcriptional regulator